MRHPSSVLVGLVAWATLGWAHPGAAQPVAPPTPGTERVAVADLVPQLGDAFVVASPAAMMGLGSASPTESSRSTPSAATSPEGVRDITPGPRAAQERRPGGVSPHLIEDSNNTALGQGALIANTSGYYNAALGVNALNKNTTGVHNTAAGAFALYANTAGNTNTASGVTALYSNTTGSWNTASGQQSLYSNTTGNGNTAAGVTALTSNIDGDFNMASGYEALYYNTTGGNNMAAGARALLSNTTGDNNAASGAQALFFNTAGSYNTADGYRALRFNTTGNVNAATGYATLHSNTTGTANTAVGVQALWANTTGNGNAALGANAGVLATTGSYNVFLGAYVNGTAADTNTIRIGLPYDAGTGVGQNQTFIAGIHGTQLAGPAVPVFVDANGQLGTLTPPVASGTGTTPAPLALDQQVQEQQATIADLRARLARLEAQMRSVVGRR